MLRIYVPREGDRVTVDTGALADYGIPRAVSCSGGVVTYSTGVITRVRLWAPLYQTPEAPCEDRFGTVLDDPELGWIFDAQALWPTDWLGPTEAEVEIMGVFWGLVAALGLEELPPGVCLADLVATVEAEFSDRIGLRAVVPGRVGNSPVLLFHKLDHMSPDNGVAGHAEKTTS